MKIKQKYNNNNFNNNFANNIVSYKNNIKNI